MRLTADEQLLKEAILDVLDSGPASRPQWDFYEDKGAQTEDGANRDRLEFVDEVINRIRRAKAPETVDVPGIGRLVTRKGLREIAAKYKLSDADREEVRKAKEAGLIRDDWWAGVPASLVEIVLEVTEEHARLMHLDAARKWNHAADMESNRVSCDCFYPVQTAQAATGLANEASKLASPNAVAFDACTAALTACALRDAPAAAEAHRRAAAAYSALGDDYDRVKPETQRRIDAGLLKFAHSDRGRAQLERQMQSYRYRNQLLHIDGVDPETPLSAIVPLVVALDRLLALGLIREEEV